MDDGHEVPELPASLRLTMAFSEHWAAQDPNTGMAVAHGLHHDAHGTTMDDATPPDTLSAPTPELAAGREEDEDMFDAPYSQAGTTLHGFEGGDLYAPGGSQGGSSKNRHRSRSRSVRYAPYAEEPASAPAHTANPKASKSVGRPSLSYAELITDAICESETGWLSLQEIYEAIKAKYSYFKTADPAWQNSIRHNLSVNATFTKVPRPAERPGEPRQAVVLARVRLFLSGKGSLWTTTKYPHGHESGSLIEQAMEDASWVEEQRSKKNRRQRKSSAGEGRSRHPRHSEEPKQTRPTYAVQTEPSSPSRSGEDSTCSTAAGAGSRSMSPNAHGTTASPKAQARDAGETGYDIVAEGAVQPIPDVEKVQNGRKTMQLLAESAFAAPNLRHILQFPSLPSDKAFASSTATICIETEEAGDQADPDLAGYLRQNEAHDDGSTRDAGKGKDSSTLLAPHQGKHPRSSPWSMLAVPSVGPDGKPIDFGKELFGRSRHGSPLPFLYSLSRATSPSSFMLGSWYGGREANATTLNLPMVGEDAPKPTSRLATTSVTAED
ncbi:hypothetical protein DFJ74DRAFT_128291 [Hyaloraphidium curvatum]|nr:hypothetical protein DFJ74DRAFT_128291 [Hyaloraphidium curvatum]